MKRVLVANRGEIARRVIRSCRALGLETVAVHSDADAEALHVSDADAAIRIGPAKPAESYLSIERIIEAARATNADAVHPGYGFLAENAAFATQVMEAGLRWIGPAAQTIAQMGDKDVARRLAEEAGVPVLPGSARFGPGDEAAIAQAAAEIGFPLLAKATAGGGGIGMQRVDNPETLQRTVSSTMSMAERAFGSPELFLERFIPRARHIEIQVFGFGDGRAVHLFERECSVQRRYQKIVEETPAPNLPPATRGAMARAAVALAAAQRYDGAGTVEFIHDAETGDFHFLEMNTRIQVEHTVTEMTTGLDIVALQLRLAAGDPLCELDQAAIRQEGSAIQCRLYAENPAMHFLPSPGRLEQFDLPQQDATLRIDTALAAGHAVTPHYDPLMAKIVAAGPDRASAIARAERALQGITIAGVKHNRDFLLGVLAHPQFRAGVLDTAFVARHGAEIIAG